MAAGLGFKDFTTGEVLTAADVDGYLMQGIWVFASTAARDAAVTAPQEGNFAFLKDTNTTTYYTGSAWTNLDTTGMVNPMTTTGDTIYSSSGSTPARLGIGTAGQVLTVNSGATAPEWATPASSGGGMTLINSGGTSLSGSSVSIGSIPGTYKDLQLVVVNFKPATDAATLHIRFNSDTTASRHISGVNNDVYTGETFSNNFMLVSNNQDNSTATGLMYFLIKDYANTTTWKFLQNYALSNDSSDPTKMNIRNGWGAYNQTGAITSIDILPSSGNFTSGTAYLYGVK